MSEALKKASWKTTAIGVVIFAGTLLTQIGNLWDSGPGSELTVCDWGVVAGAFGVMCGLFFTRDADKSSEDAGIKG